MNVIVAMQAPTLFNQLRRSSEWNLWMEPMGDHEGLMETQLAEVPLHGRSDPNPDVVLVCSPSHLQFAQRRWPHAKMVWVFHNGYERLLPDAYADAVDGAIAFSHRVCHLQSAASEIDVHYVSVAYETQPVWSWSRELFWSMRNRPSTRKTDTDMVIAMAMRDRKFTCYGQDQPAGFLDSEHRMALMQRCSAYVSCLPRSAGFGLAEHEMMAAGVPVLGTPWGDIERELGTDDVSHGYPLIVQSIEQLPFVANRASENAALCERASESGLRYIEQFRTTRAMDRSIAALGDKLFSG